MKGFQKLALAAAISAAPFAQAELTSIDDAALSDMTGQSGISIELSAQVSIGSIEYTDTDTNGTIGINGIVLGGNGGGALENIKIDIDVDETAGLIIHLGGTNTSDVLTGGADKVDFGLDVAGINLNGGSNLVSNVVIGGNLGPIDVIIANNGDIGVKAYFEVTNGSLDLDVLGVGVTSLTVGQDSQPILAVTSDYATTLATVQAGAVLANAANITGAGDIAEGAASITDVDDGAGGAPDGLDDVTGLNLADTQAAARATAEADTTALYEAGAVAGVSNMAYVGMSISTVSTGYLDTTTFQPVEVANALNIVIDSMSMDINVGLTMGETVTRDGGGVITSSVGRSFGSVAINDLDLSGTSLTIYGH